MEEFIFFFLNHEEKTFCLLSFGKAENYMDETIPDKLMYIPTDYTQKYPFYRLQLVVETFGH